ncbi:MAG: hypothetical protein MJ069_00270 [Salinivirgaceae bacterium]|nr:hypothetical protein [Salinivirgaceae bacterium]
MKVLKHLIIIGMCVTPALVYAQIDSTAFDKQQIITIEQKLNVQQERLSELDKMINEKASISQINSVQANLTNLKSAIEEQKVSVENLMSMIEQNKQNIKKTADQLGVEIDKTKVSLNAKANNDDLQNKSIIGFILLTLLAVILAVIAFVFGKRISKSHTDVDELKQKAEKINEDILNKFSVEMNEMQKISASLSALSDVQKSNGNAEQDHSLIKTLADRITFMEMTLYKMDKDVRGYKQLSKSIAQMKDNLLANGYELVDMLGKEYNEGMRATANFIDDDSIELGKQIITAIIKPQINYKGVMIQAAQITVSQNN